MRCYYDDVRPLAFALFAATLIAQEPPVLRVTTRVVQVNVVVTDKSGHPVDGLTQDDFILKEDGRPQQIAGFSVERSRVLPPPAEPLPPDIFTNRYELKGGAPSSATAILFDTLNTRQRDKYFARDEFAKFLRTQLQPSDRVALYVLGHDLRLLHDFTSDAAGLLAALDGSPRAIRLLDSFDPDKGGIESSPAAGAVAIDMKETEKKADEKLSDTYAAVRVYRTAAALEAIGSRLAALPGRKSLVWITGGIPAYIGLEDELTARQKRFGVSRLRMFTDQIEQVARRLGAADVAVYPVDAQGLLALPGPRARFPENYLAARGTLRTLAARTGGRATVDNNDIAGAVRRALDDSRITYTLSYQPTHDQWDGRFRSIKVATRRPGVTLRHRGGYFADGEQSVTPQNREKALDAAIASPLEATGIRLVVALKPDTPTPGRLAVRILMEPADVRLVQKDGRWIAQLDIAYVQWAVPADPHATAIKRHLELPLSPAEFQTALEKGLVVQDDLSASSSAHLLRIIVHDASTGATGSVEIVRSTPASVSK